MTEYITIEKKVYDKLIKSVERIDALEKEVEELKRRLWVYENPNIPSGKQIINEKKEHVEEPKKKGAPEGHLGATRKKPKPNRYIDLKPKTCKNCGSANLKILGKERRVIEDIKIEKIVTEFTQYEFHCGGCGKDDFTTHEELPIRGDFGPTLCKTWNALHYIGRIPFDLLSKISGNLLYTPITAPGIMDVIYRTTERFEPFYDAIKEELPNSKYARSDETSYPYNGDNWWCWCISNQNLTLFLIKPSRGSVVLNSVFGEKFEGQLVSDCHPLYDKFIADYQKCWSHILRFSEKAAELDTYAEMIDERLHDMYNYIVYVKQNRLEGTPEVMKNITLMRRQIQGLRKDKRRDNITERLIKRLQKYEEDWFKCLIYSYVEPTNNASEREIRKAVVARKISGQHRSERGVHCREIMMSTLQTMEKRGVNNFDFIDSNIRSYNATLLGS